MTSLGACTGSGLFTGPSFIFGETWRGFWASPKSFFRPRPVDQRGAALVLGLFLALGVISALWCVIGIGDAIVARDRSQEAADSVAYASAVLHARGMNFIALINILIMAMTMLYLLFTMLDLMLSLVLVFTGITEPSPNWCGLKYVSWLFGAPVNWCSVARAVEAVEVPLYRLDRAFFDRYKKISVPLFHVQSWAATGVPFLALAAGAASGVKYDHAGIAYSHVLFPGGGAPKNINFARPLANKIPFAVRKVGADDRANVIRDRRIGLPVESEQAWKLCVRAGRFSLDWLLRLPYDEEFGGKTWGEWATTEPTASVTALLFHGAGETLRFFFCRHKEPMAAGETFVQGLRTSLSAGLLGIRAEANDKFYLKNDSFWKINADSGGRFEDSDSEYVVGPKRVVDYAYNGSDWMQTWAAVQSFESIEKSVENVGTPATVFGQGLPGELSAPDTRWYFAEAEYYLDCNSTWMSADCNKSYSGTYKMSWRARQRRLHWPNVANMAFEYFFNNFMSGPVTPFLSEKAFAKMTMPARESLFDYLVKLPHRFINTGSLTDDTTVDDYYH